MTRLLPSCRLPLLPVVLPALAALALVPAPARAGEAPSAASSSDAASPDSTSSDAAVRLPERVVTATRVPTLAEQIPAGVSVIDRQTIEERGYTTLVEALSAVPGMTVVPSGGPGGPASVFMRGTNSNHVLVLRDGVPVSDPSYPTDAFNFGVDTLADVERIEVVRGPMSGLYGSGAVGGVINIITRKGESGTHGSVEVGGGLPRAGEVAANLRGRQDMVDYSATVSSQSSIGADVTPSRMKGVHTGERDGFRSQLADINLGITPVVGTRFYGGLRYRESVYGYDAVGFDAPNYRGYDRTASGRVGVQQKLFDGAWETDLSVARLDTQRRYRQPWSLDDPSDSSSYARYAGRRTAIAWANTVHVQDFGPATATAVTFGIDHQRDAASSALDASYSGYPYTSSMGGRAQNTAGHAGLQTTLFDRLTLSGSVRQENATYGDDAFTWRTGGVLAVPEVWSRLKLSYGTSFRAPSLYDLFGVDSYGYVGNPNLKPEKSEGWEAGWAVDVPLFARRDGATLEATYFSNRIRNLIETIYTADYSASTPENISSVQTHGVETSLTLRPGPWAEAVLAWTYTEAHAADGTRLLRRPKHQASFTLVTHPIERLTISPELLYRSGAADYIVSDEGLQTGTGLTKPGLILNLTATYKLTNNFSLFVNGYNLTDSHYEAASGYQTPGARFLAGVRARF